MVWHILPGRAHHAPEWDANYRLQEISHAPQAGLPDNLGALVEPYADFFAYAVPAGGNKAALIEGLLRLETIGAPLDASIAPLWQNLAQNGLTVAEDENKQRADRLFGLDGNAGLLGELKRNRQIAAQELLIVSGAERREFLHLLVAFAGRLLPGSTGVDLWSWQKASGEVERSATPALPLYLQALGLIVLVQGWIGGHPGLAVQAAICRHRAFLLGTGSAAGSSPADWHPGSEALSAVLDAATQALAR